MSGTIPMPLFLQSGKAQDLNSKLISNNKSFAFLGETYDIINKTPSTYAEAFDQYISGLYVLYHDCGMFFLKSYTNQANILYNDYSYTAHISFVYNSRGALQHSDDYNTREYVYTKLKNYYFRNDTTFTYNDWHEFWLKASEIHWKRLVKRIVDDSNKLYTDYMIKIAAQDISLKTIHESISDIFSAGEYYDTKNNCVKIYDRSLDKRFLNNISNKLKNTFVWSDQIKAEQELKDFQKLKELSESEIVELHQRGKFTPHEIKSEAITEMKNYLLSGYCKNSEALFQLLCQTIYDLIENQIKADIESETEDMLD